MSVLIVIPARFGSTRLPGKPLLAETGKPLIQHTYEAAAAAAPEARVVVATDDERIERAVRAFGGEAAMTDPVHSTGSARVAEAARGTEADVVVNLQGDEPEVEPEAVRTLIDLHREAKPFVSTLVSRYPRGRDLADPDAVKAVLSQPLAGGHRRALWFSRSPLPHARAAAIEPAYLHIGLYAYSPESLQAFTDLLPTPLELTESLEQLRVLEHGHSIAAAIVPPAAPGIDTRADYDAFVARQAGR